MKGISILATALLLVLPLQALDFKALYDGYAAAKERAPAERVKQSDESGYSSGISPLKNNTIEKKKLFQSLGCDKVYSNKVVETCYSFGNKGALAVAYTIDAKTVNLVNLDERGEWFLEEKIPHQYRATNQDYIRTGYDKGHSAPDSAYDWNQRVLQETYNLNLNAVPMSAEVNRKTWIKAEKYSKQITSKLTKVDVIDIFEYGSNPKRIGHGQIAVPEKLYKILYNKENDFKRCFEYKNDLNVETANDKLKEHEIDCSKFI